MSQRHNLTFLEWCETNSDKGKKLLQEYSETNDKKPFQIMAQSRYKAKWKCSICGYEWEAFMFNRAGKGRGCPCCSGHVVAAGINDLATTNPELLEYWDYARNTIKPTEISAKNNSLSISWVCKNDKRHIFNRQVNRMILSSECPVCANKLTKVVEGTNDFKTKYPLLLKYWNDRRSPSSFTSRSGKVVSWKCEKGHDFDAAISRSAWVITTVIDDLNRKNMMLLFQIYMKGESMAKVKITEQG